jgi:hypothetical protein
MMEGGAAATARRAVMLAISTNDTDVSEMAVSSDPGLTGASWEPFTPTRGWLLSEGDGQKTVYVKLRDRAGQESAVFSSTIRRDTIVAPFKLVSSAGDQTGDAGTTISGTVEPGSKVLVNGIMAQVAADGSFRQAVALQEGSNVIVVTVVDAAGNLFVTEFNNHVVRKITPQGDASTFVGNGTSTDIVEASALAYMDVINKVARMRKFGKRGMRKIGVLE